MEDIEIVKKSVTEEMDRIQAQIALLDSEESTMLDLIGQSNTQAQLVDAWRNAGIRQKQNFNGRCFQTASLIATKNTYLNQVSVQACSRD